MKKLTFIVLFLIIFSFSSCVGIGDGEFINEPDFSSKPVEETTPAVIDASLPTQVMGVYLDTIKGIEPLYSDTVDEISAAWNKQYTGNLFYDLNKDTAYSDLYLGIVGEYAVVGFNDKAPPSPGQYQSTDYLVQYVSAAGYDFYVSGRMLYLYKDGAFESDIEKLYREGKLTAEDVRTINYRYHEYVRYYDPDFEWLDKVPINEEELASVNEALEKRSGMIYADSLEKTTGERYCFGKFGENIVFKITDEKETGDFFTLDIDGVSFHGYDREFEIWVLRGGELYTLSDAYASGFISKAELVSMSKYNNDIALYNEREERAGLR